MSIYGTCLSCVCEFEVTEQLMQKYLTAFEGAVSGIFCIPAGNISFVGTSFSGFGWVIPKNLKDISF